MLGLGLPELILILAIVLLFFGAKRLPGLSKDLSDSGKEFKEAFTDGEVVSVKDVAKDVGESTRKIKEEVRSIKETQV